MLDVYCQSERSLQATFPPCERCPGRRDRPVSLSSSLHSRWARAGPEQRPSSCCRDHAALRDPCSERFSPCTVEPGLFLRRSVSIASRHARPCSRRQQIERRGRRRRTAQEAQKDAPSVRLPAVPRTSSLPGTTCPRPGRPPGADQSLPVRSCDHCRDKRLRCDYIPDHEPPLCTECHKVRSAISHPDPAAEQYLWPSAQAFMRAHPAGKDGQAQGGQTGPHPTQGILGRSRSFDVRIAEWPRHACSLVRAAPFPVSTPALRTGGLLILPGIVRSVDRVSERMKQEKAETPDPALFTTSDLRMMGTSLVRSTPCAPRT